MASGTDISLARPGGPTFRAHLALPSAPPARPGVVVIHEIFGLTDDIRRITQRFASSGYAALAPDLYDGPSAKPICVAKTLVSMRSGKGAAYDDIETARAHLAGLPEVDGARIGIAGFCMGGAFALLTARRGAYRAAAPYYGAVPEEARQLEGICPVVAGFGGKDRPFAPQGERLRRHLETLNVAHDVKIYPEAGHSYMSHHDPTLLIRLGAIGPMKAGYNEAAAEDSWARMLAFFEKHL